MKQLKAAQTYLHKHTYTHIHRHRYTHTYTDTGTHTHIRPRAHTHTHTHTKAQRKPQSLKVKTHLNTWYSATDGLVSMAMEIFCSASLYLPAMLSCMACILLSAARCSSANIISLASGWLGCTARASLTS